MSEELFKFNLKLKLKIFCHESRTYYNLKVIIITFWNFLVLRPKELVQSPSGSPSSEIKSRAISPDIQSNHPHWSRPSSWSLPSTFFFSSPLSHKLLRPQMLILLNFSKLSILKSRPQSSMGGGGGQSSGGTQQQQQQQLLLLLLQLVQHQLRVKQSHHTFRI